MRAAKCGYNSRMALYRVFILPFEKAEVLPRQSGLSIPSSRVLPPVLAPMPSLLRHASLVRRFKAPRTAANTETTSKPGLPSDELISDFKIMLVDNNNKLQGPMLTREVLASLDAEEESLRMVSRAPRVPADEQPRFAICKIVNKLEEQEKERASEKARKEQSRKAVKTKELELNWAIAPNDLKHKLKQLRTFLEKGHKVDVLFAKKKGSRLATREEADALIQAVRDAMAEIDGAREWKEPDGTPLKVMKLYLSAPSKSKET